MRVERAPYAGNQIEGRSRNYRCQHPSRHRTGNPALGDPSPDRWFNTAAFTTPTFGSFGNAPRNLLEGPGYQNVNLAFLKHVNLSEQTRLQLRLEAFNLFNHVNFNLPDAFLGSPTFGRVTSADSPRRCQFGVRLIF